MFQFSNTDVTVFSFAALFICSHMDIIVFSSTPVSYYICIYSHGYHSSFTVTLIINSFSSCLCTYDPVSFYSFSYFSVCV